MSILIFKYKFFVEIVRSFLFKFSGQNFLSNSEFFQCVLHVPSSFIVILPDGKVMAFNFHSCTAHLDIIKVFYIPTDAQ